MIRRKKYFIHPSSQLKYIAMSVLPALGLSVFCIAFFVTSGELILKREKEKIFLQTAKVNVTVNETLSWLAEGKYSRGLSEKTTALLKELVSLDSAVQTAYFDIVRQWAKSKQLLLAAVLSILTIVAMMSLIYSHRVAGPLYRLRRDIEMLAEGKTIPAVRLRKYDEFKELAASLEKLRCRLQGGQRI